MSIYIRLIWSKKSDVTQRHYRLVYNHTKYWISNILCGQKACSSNSQQQPVSLNISLSSSICCAPINILEKKKSGTERALIFYFLPLVYIYACVCTILYDVSYLVSPLHKWVEGADGYPVQEGSQKERKTRTRHIYNSFALSSEPPLFSLSDSQLACNISL